MIIAAVANDIVGKLSIGYDSRKIDTEIRRIRSPTPGDPAGYNKKRCCFMRLILGEGGRAGKLRKMYLPIAHSSEREVDRRLIETFCERRPRKGPG